MQIEPLFTAEDIAERIRHMAEDIAASYQEPITIVGLLRGSFIFAADLVRALHAHNVPLSMDFMTLSSYGNAMQSSGKVQLRSDIQDAVAGKHVLVVDDILETGHTLQMAMDVLRNHGAAEVQAAVLLEKPGKRHVEIGARWVGFTIPDQFVVGYGMDYKNQYRELPYIGAKVSDAA